MDGLRGWSVKNRMPHKLCGNSPGTVARNNLATMTKTPSSLDLPEISHTRLTGLLDFLQAAEQLKDTLRSGTTTGGRPESTAEHSWRLALMVLLFEPELKEIDMLKLLKLTLVHDLGEAISGDVPAPLQTPGDDRQERERRDFLTLCKPLPGDVAGELPRSGMNMQPHEPPKPDLPRRSTSLRPCFSTF